MWNYLRKRFAVRSYRTTLATKLQRRYGKEHAYTPEQVWGAAVDSGVSTKFLCFAFAMFCDQPAFDAYHAERGEACDYAAMRSDLGHWLFDGNTDFDATTFEVPDLGGHHGHHVGDHGGGHDFSHDHHVGHHDVGHHDFTGFDGGGCSHD